MPWTKIESEQAIAELYKQFGGFHDSCLREVLVFADTWVHKNRAMTVPDYLDTSAMLWLQSQGPNLTAIEFYCAGVTNFRATPTPAGRASIIWSGVVTLTPEGPKLVLQFSGIPLRAEPGSVIEYTHPERAPSGLEVIAEEMYWRALPDALGEVRRYKVDGTLESERPPVGKLGGK